MTVISHETRCGREKKTRRLDDVVQVKRPSHKETLISYEIAPSAAIRQKYTVSISSIRNLIESKRCKYVHGSEDDNDGSRHQING